MIVYNSDDDRKINMNYLIFSSHLGRFSSCTGGKRRKKEEKGEKGMKKQKEKRKKEEKGIKGDKKGRKRNE